MFVRCRGGPAEIVEVKHQADNLPVVVEHVVIAYPATPGDSIEAVLFETISQLEIMAVLRVMGLRPREGSLKSDPSLGGPQGRSVHQDARGISGEVERSDLCTPRFYPIHLALFTEVPGFTRVDPIYHLAFVGMGGRRSTVLKSALPLWPVPGRDSTTGGLHWWLAPR